MDLNKWCEDEKILCDFASRLRALRILRGETQQETAEAVGVTQSAFALYEGKNRMPKYKHLLDLSRHFNISIDWLVGNISYSDTVVNVKIAENEPVISDTDDDVLPEQIIDVSRVDEIYV
jgi:transcriptional regulator with XRE-family HTH domain